MAQHQVQDPQGQLHIIEAPDGATPDQILAHAPSLIPSQSASMPQAQPSNTGLQDVADTISKGLNFINNPGGGPPPGTNLMQPQGDSLFQKGAGNVAEYLGGKNLPGNPYTAAAIATPIAMGNPENWLSNPSALPENVKLPGTGMAEDIAQSSARRALGYTKGMLKKPGALDRANQVGQTMLDQNVIKNPLTHPLSFGAEDTYGRASDLADTSGQAIGNTINDLSNANRSGIDGPHLAAAVDAQIGPSLQGGLYNKDANIVNEIKDTILAHGKGELSLNSLQALKQKLGEAANFNKISDATRSSLYQKAYGIVNSEIERSVGNITEGTPIGDQYLQNKSIYGASKEAEKALLNRMSSEAGNRRIGLTDVIAGGSELAAGHPGIAAGLIGLKHGVETAGNALTARVANYLAQSGRIRTPLALAPIIAAYIQSRNQGHQQ